MRRPVVRSLQTLTSTKRCGNLSPAERSTQSAPVRRPSSPPRRAGWEDPEEEVTVEGPNVGAGRNSGRARRRDGARRIDQCCRPANPAAPGASGRRGGAGAGTRRPSPSPDAHEDAGTRLHIGPTRPQGPRRGSGCRGGRGGRAVRAGVRGGGGLKRRTEEKQPGRLGGDPGWVWPPPRRPGADSVRTTCGSARAVVRNRRIGTVSLHGSPSPDRKAFVADRECGSGHEVHAPEMLPPRRCGSVTVPRPVPPRWVFCRCHGTHKRPIAWIPAVPDALGLFSPHRGQKVACVSATAGGRWSS